jgi:hypothetical protein
LVKLLWNAQAPVYASAECVIFKYQSMADVVFSTKDFSSLECNEAFVLGCEFKNLARIMQDVNENDVVGLAISQND